MRSLIIISSSFLVFLGLNLPVMSQSPVEIVQTVNRDKLNLRRLQFNYRLWKQKNIVNYRYTLSNSCFCTPEARGPVIIEVRNGQTTSITSVATGSPVDPQLFQNYNTIPKLFNLIQDAINRKADSLNVRYDARFGYPTQIDINYSFQIADEEVYLTIENFQELR